MKKPFLLRRPLLLLALLTIAAAGGWFFTHRGGGHAADKADPAPPSPVARVRVAPARRGQIERTLVAYGVTVPAPGATRSLSFPFESRVVSVQANAGQPVAAGDLLLCIEPSADARLALDTAASARDAAERALKETQVRFRVHLATNQDLAAAEAAARDIRLKSESLQARGLDPDGEVRAPVGGTVTKVAAQPGAVIPAGTPLVELALGRRLEARLGIAPADAPEVQIGQTARLSPVEGQEDQAKGAPFIGAVRVVGRSVDSATRLVDVIVTVEEAPGVSADLLLIGNYLRAEIVVEAKQALLVPRVALLPKADAPGTDVIFTLRDGHARRCEVKGGLDDGREVEVVDGDGSPSEGENVVTEGNYELEDGMAVEVANGSSPAAAGGTAP